MKWRQAISNFADLASPERVQWRNLKRRAETAEQERDQLRAALADAVEGMDDMIEYVPDYFRVKWGHDAFLARGRAALGGETSLDAEADRRASRIAAIHCVHAWHRAFVCARCGTNLPIENADEG